MYLPAHYAYRTINFFLFFIFFPFSAADGNSPKFPVLLCMFGKLLYGICSLNIQRTSGHLTAPPQIFFSFQSQSCTDALTPGAFPINNHELQPKATGVMGMIAE